MKAINSSETQLHLPLPSAECLSGLIFDPDDGSNMFLRNVGHYPNYMGLQTRRHSQSYEHRIRQELPNLLVVTKCRSVRWAGHVVSMGAKRHVNRVLVGKREETTRKTKT
jgi:hypothetical protein